MTKRVFIAVLLVALAVAANAPGAFAQTVNASADSWVTERYPNRNYGTQATMRSAPQPRKRTFVRFEIPALDGPWSGPSSASGRRTARPGPAGLLDRLRLG